MKYTLQTTKGRIDYVSFSVLQSAVRAQCRLVYLGYNPPLDSKVYQLYTKST
jgi:hypothetical protein